MPRSVRGLAIAAVGLSLVSACGREPIQAPAPQPIVLEMQPVGDRPERATAQVFDLGRDTEVRLFGENFRTDGAYTAQWSRATFVRYMPIALYPSPIAVQPDGDATFIGIFSAWDSAAPNDQIVVLFHPGGDATNLASAERVLTAPLPEALFP